MPINFVVKPIHFFLAAHRLRRDRVISYKSAHSFAHHTSGLSTEAAAHAGFSLLSLAELLQLKKVSNGLCLHKPSLYQFWRILSLNNKLIFASSGLSLHKASSHQFWRTLSLNNKLILANRGLCPHKPQSGFQSNFHPSWQ